MHLRAQRFQTRVIEQICSLQSICKHLECCQRVRFHVFSRFVRLLSSETLFSMIKPDSRLVHILFSFDVYRVKRAIGADPHASPICSKSFSLDARRSKCASGLFRSVFVIWSNVVSLDARRSKCVFHMLRCALARRPSIQMRFPCAQKCSRVTLVDLNALSFWKVFMGSKMA